MLKEQIKYIKGYEIQIETWGYIGMMMQRDFFFFKYYGYIKFYSFKLFLYVCLCSLFE